MNAKHCLLALVCCLGTGVALARADDWITYEGKELTTGEKAPEDQQKPQK